LIAADRRRKLNWTLYDVVKHLESGGQSVE